MRCFGKKFGQVGDTIIEVMAAITILGLALGTAYALSNRSLRTAVHTHDRVEALALAQGQVEFLRDKGLTNQISPIKAAYSDSSKSFCFDDISGNLVDGTCPSYKGTIYDISINYCPVGSCDQAETNVFTVKATWIAGGSGSQNQLTLYYKSP